MTKNFKPSYITIILYLLFCAFLSIYRLSGTQAQDIVTATPSGLTVVQGNTNLGDVQPFSLSEVMIGTGIRVWHDAGWTGNGQKIGVLDRGFGGLADFETQFGITVQLAPGQTREAYHSSSISHGTQVLEILHMVAPNARLYICQYDNFTQFVPCVNWMISNDVDIINHSAGVPSLPLDGTNEWAREVDRTARAGIIWVNAAGNFANGYVDDFFTDSSPFNTYHEFRGTRGLESLGISPVNQSEGVVSLSWQGSSTIPANAIDLDLEIVDADGNIINASMQPQAGQPGQAALEYVIIPMNQEFFVRVRDTSGQASGVHFVLFIEFASLPAGQAGGSIVAPGDSQNAITVGSLQGNIIAPYSSRGPVASGAIKPDLTAPGEIILNNGQRFIGTSASAPVVAGLAALIWEANPIFSREEVVSFLRQRSIQDDSFIPGADNVYGFGFVYLPVPEITPTLFPSPTLSPTQTPTATLTPTLTQTIAPAHTETPAPTITASFDNPIAVVMVERANVRFGPGSTYDIISNVGESARLPIVAQAYDNTWYLVSLIDGIRGWIPSSVVDVEPSDATVQVAATIPGAFAPTPSYTPTPSATPTIETISSSNNATAIVTSESANLRSGPGTQYNVVEFVTQNTRLPIVAQVYNNTWYLIERPNGQPAWIAGSVVRVETGSAIIPVAVTIPASFAPQLTDIPNFSPVISNAYTGGTCDNHYYEVVWSDADNNTSEIWAISRMTGARFDTQIINGGSGTTRFGPYYGCQSSRCTLDFLVVDHSGNQSSRTTAYIDCN